MIKPKSSYYPLAERMRPNCLSEIVGQKELIGKDGIISKMLAEGNLRSMILWGTPGVGKTTLARVLAKTINFDILEFSGARAKITDLRTAVDNWMVENNYDIDLYKYQNNKKVEINIFNQITNEAVSSHSPNKKKLLVFVDEIHRYNKAQQDYFLPWVEQGLFTLIGATTENPGFEINNALLSRCSVMILNPLAPEELRELLMRGIKILNIKNFFTDDAIDELINHADGDGRRLLNDLEAIFLYGEKSDNSNFNTKQIVDKVELRKILGQRLRRFDKGGDIFYDQISALHKAVRGSDPDASLYWFMRMIDGGCDPLYIARRMIRMASEDIGLADPQALTLAISATNAYERLGAPEGILAIAQVIIYFAVLPKSNAVYTAYNQAKKFIAEEQTRAVPNHIRNAPTKIHKQIGAGENYRYAHDEPDAYAAGENYWGEGIEPQKWYTPTDRGLENKIRERLKLLKDKDIEYLKNKK